MQNRLFDIQEAVAESSDELIALRRDFPRSSRAWTAGVPHSPDH